MDIHQRKEEILDAIPERVERGARLLDREVPGWHEKIEIEELRMESCSMCILGQLNGNYRSVIEGLNGMEAESEESREWAAERGFNTSHDEVGVLGYSFEDMYFLALGRRWHDEIEARRKE